MDYEQMSEDELQTAAQARASARKTQLAVEREDDGAWRAGFSAMASGAAATPIAVLSCDGRTRREALERLLMLDEHDREISG